MVAIALEQSPLKDLRRPILKCVFLADPVDKARKLLDRFECVIKSFHSQPMTHSAN